MAGRTLFTLLAVVLTGLLSAGQAAAQSGASMVWCHDVGRALVRLTAPNDCRGETVSEEEARQIKAERAERIRRRMQGRAPLVQGTRRRGSGSGFFVSANGHVVTNNHVIEGYRAVSIVPPGAKEVTATVLAAEPAHDLALLKAEVAPASVATFREPTTLRQGEDIAVVGYPLHGLVAIKPIMVTGHVYIGTEPPRADLFAMSIDIRRGNSGGPVADRAGRIVGVVVAKVNTPAVFAATGQVVRNLGYGIRLPVVQDFLRRHDVTPWPETAFEERDDKALFGRVTAYVVRIGCWK